MDYLHRIEKINAESILWNVPEQKQGAVNVVGGNMQNFRTPTRVAEYLGANSPLKTVNLVLPDILRNKLPPLDNFVFLDSTESGSFSNSEEITDTLNATDYNLLVGDFSKNNITAKAIQDACKNATKPTLVTRDTVDLIAVVGAERILMNHNLVIFGSMAQLQKLFHAIFYPKMLMMSQSLIQVAEIMHKFTLSYPVAIITLHDGQILIVQNGTVNVVPLEKTHYSPLTLWSGELASRIVALNLYNPNNFLEATTAALKN